VPVFKMMLFDKFAPQRKCPCRPGIDGEPTLDPIGRRRDGGDIADECQGQAHAISLVSEIRSGNESQRAMVSRSSASSRRRIGFDRLCWTRSLMI
jgi:hypothetical protein